MCQKNTVCGDEEFETEAPTASTDRICVPMLQCNVFTDGGGSVGGSGKGGPRPVEYIAVPGTPTSDRECAPVSVCLEVGVQFESVAPTRTSDRVCSNVTVCPDGFDESVAPTGTSDRGCIDTQAASGTPTSVISAAAVAGVMAVVLLLVAARYKRTREKIDGHDIMLEDANPHLLSPAVAPSNSAAMGRLMPFAAGEKSCAELTARGDRLWKDFRRCTAFDHMYFGNNLFALSDTALEDVYAILAVPCPRRDHFGTLRAVASRFAQQSASQDGVIDDTVDFIVNAMPDVLVERALDMFATADDPPTDFYEAIDEYLAGNNPFFSGPAGQRGLAAAAASRELRVVEPLYYEVNTTDEYSLISSDQTYEAAYPMAGVQEDSEYQVAGAQEESAYSLAHGAAAEGAESPYAMGAAGSGADNVYSVGTAEEDTYAMATSPDASNGAAVDATYASASAADPVYGMASPGAGVAAAAVEATYDTANAVGAAEAVYAAASPTEATYAMANGEQRAAAVVEATYAMGSAGEPIYAVGSGEEATYELSSPGKDDGLGEAYENASRGPRGSVVLQAMSRQVSLQVPEEYVRAASFSEQGEMLSGHGLNDSHSASLPGNPRRVALKESDDGLERQLSEQRADSYNESMFLNLIEQGGFDPSAAGKAVRAHGSGASVASADVANVSEADMLQIAADLGDSINSQTAVDALEPEDQKPEGWYGDERGYLKVAGANGELTLPRRAKGGEPEWDLDA